MKLSSWKLILWPVWQSHWTATCLNMAKGPSRMMMSSRNRYFGLRKNSRLLLLCCLQLLHGLIVTVVYFLLEKLTMVLHRLHLLRPALLLSGQLLQTQTHRKIKVRRRRVGHQHLQRTTIQRWTFPKQLASLPAFQNPIVHPTCESALSAASCHWTCPRC